MTVFKLTPQPVHTTVNDCLRHLSVALSDLAEVALAELPLAGEAQGRGTALSFESCVKSGDKITNCLLLSDGTARGAYVLLGDLQPGGKASKGKLLENFKPTASLELFALLGDLYTYAAGAKAKGAKGPRITGGDDPVPVAEAILVRALTLADSIAFLFRTVEAELLVRLVKSQDGSQEELSKLAQDYATSVKKHAQMIGAFIQDRSVADKLTRDCMVNLPASVTFAIDREQRCINGMYFPPEMEKSLIKKLAAAQARTISDRG